ISGDGRSAEMPARPGRRCSRSALTAACPGQIDAAFCEDLRCKERGQHSDQRAGKDVPEVVCTDHDAAHTHNRGYENIEETVLRPKKPERSHQRDNRGAMPRGKRPVVRPPTEPGKAIEVGLEEQFWPGSPKENFQYIDNDAGGGDRKK